MKSYKPNLAPALVSRCFHAGLIALLHLSPCCPVLAENENRPPTEDAEETTQQLEKFTWEEAKKAKLATDLRRVLPPAMDDKKLFGRARFEVQVSGAPKAVREYLDNLHDIDKFRAIASMRLSDHPNSPDDRQCLVEINQWFTADNTTATEEKLKKDWIAVVKDASTQVSPLDAWNGILKCIPKDSGLRLIVTDIAPQGGATNPKELQIRIVGSSEAIAAVEQFGENLSKNKRLDGFEWETPVPTKGKNGTWQFLVSGVPSIEPAQ